MFPGHTMRKGMAAVAAALLLSAAAGCGRIAYDAVGTSGVAGGPGVGGGGGTSASGRGGSAGGNGGGGNGGSVGAGGIGGSSGGAGGSSAGAGGSSAGAGGSSAGGGGGGAGGTSGAGGGTAGAACTADSFGGHSYAFCFTPLAWSNAAADCTVKGMRLARIDDAAENAWLVSVAFASAPDQSSTYWPWIGGTDQAVVGEWRWTDGALFWLGASNGAAQGGLYAKWVGGSPTSGGGATDCGILQYGSYWRDWDCTRLEPYVCEQY